MPDASAKKWCEACGSSIKGAHLPGCNGIGIVGAPKLVDTPEKKKPARKRSSVTVRLDDDDPEIMAMKNLSHVMDYCIKRENLSQRQIDRIGNWFVDKYIDEIKWP